MICDPLNLNNGQEVYSGLELTGGGFPLDTMVTFSCDYAFRLSGSNSALCQISGTWNQIPQCIEGKEENTLEITNKNPHLFSFLHIISKLQKVS